MKKTNELLIFSMFLMGCSSSPNLYYMGGGAQCPVEGSSGDTILWDLSVFPGFTQMQWSDLTSSAAQKGSFTYTGALLYFYDGNSHFTIEVSDGKNPASVGGYSQITPCVRNRANIGGLKSTSVATQFMSDLTFSNGTWKAAAKTVGFELIGQKIVAISNDITLKDNAVSADLRSLFPDYDTAPSPDIQTHLVVWCSGSCKDTDTTKNYQIRASRISIVSPFDKMELVTYYTWTQSAAPATSPPKP